MLTSITPLGERGRGHHWALTSGWLLAGHLLGGLALGAVLAAIGSGLSALDALPGTVRSAQILGAVVLAGAAFDLSGLTVPGRRQVDERWLNTYRGWVYAGGFGLQLGFGLVTVVNTALLGALVVAGVLLSPGNALVVGVLYGAVRGLAATANGWVRNVADLRRLHRWLDRADRPARWSAASIGAASAIAALVAA